MATFAVVGFSAHTRGFFAGREATEQALRSLAHERGAGVVLPLSALLLFSTCGYDQASLVAGVRSIAGDVPVAGCSAEGVITQHGAREGAYAVAVLALFSDRWRCHALCERQMSLRGAEAGTSLAQRVRQVTRDERAVVLVFMDGLSRRGPEAIGALEAAAGPNYQIVGGGAADMFRFRRTYQYFADEVLSDGLVALVIQGCRAAEIAVGCGCVPLGLPRLVTRSDGHVVAEIDHQPAWTLMREYVDAADDAREVSTLAHLAVMVHGDAGKVAAVRSPYRVERREGAVHFISGLDEGRVIQMTRRNPETLRGSVQRVAASMRERQGGRLPQVVLQIEDVFRGRLLLGDRTDEILVSPLAEGFGQGSAWIGFFSFCGLASVGGSLQVHNDALVLCALYDFD